MQVRMCVRTWARTYVRTYVPPLLATNHVVEFSRLCFLVILRFPAESKTGCRANSVTYGHPDTKETAWNSDEFSKTNNIWIVFMCFSNFSWKFIFLWMFMKFRWFVVMNVIELWLIVYILLRIFSWFWICVVFLMNFREFYEFLSIFYTYISFRQFSQIVHELSSFLWSWR